MASLDAVADLNAAWIQSQPLVAVFFGGTGGIGHATLRELSKNEAKLGKGLRAYVVGRKAEPAERIIAECRSIYPKGDFIFVRAQDLSLLKDVDRICTEIKRQEEESHGTEASIDYLMFGQGGSIFNPRIDTKEGLDEAMALMYYSRMRAILDLLPLLLKSTLPATIVSVYAGGFEAKFFPDDLSLRAPKRFTYALARSHMVYMHTLFFESLVAQHPGRLRLVHIFPGFVIGPGFQNPELPAWFRFVFGRVVLPLFGRWITIPPEVCAQRMLALASKRYPAGPHVSGAGANDVCVGTDGRPGSGAYALGKVGQDALKTEAYRKFDKDAMRQKVWEHTNRAFSVIEGGDVFLE